MSEKRSGGARFAPEVRERAVRMVLEHAEAAGSERASICSISGKIGCSPELPR